MAGGVYTTPPEGNVAQGPRFGPAAFQPRHGFAGAACTFSETVFGGGPSLDRIILFATRPEPASLEEPQGRTAGPALPRPHQRRTHDKISVP